MLDQLIEFDRSLLLYLNNLGAPLWDGFWLVVTNKLTFVPLYLVLIILIVTTKRLTTKEVVVLVFTIAGMILFTDQITNLFKFTFERLRPCAQEGVLEYIRQGKCRGYGFFSGHSSNSMATAIFTGLMLRPIYRKLIYYMIVWSIVVAYSRIYLGLHYPLDILCGLTFGVLSGCLFYSVFKRLRTLFVKTQ
jgi:undecaprenyl-diphosphatase